MKKIIYRLFVVIASLVVGVALVASITYLGKESSGPVEDAFSRIGKAISEFEETYILKQRSKSRSAKLAWFTEAQYNRESLRDPKKIFLGAYDNEAKTSFQPIITLEDSLQTEFPLIHIYGAWGSKREQRFPSDQVRSIATLGSIPVITWEPWLNDFEGSAFKGLPSVDERNKKGLQSVAEGMYDPYLIRWARDAREAKVTLLIRLGHEMNDPYRYPWGPQNNEPEDYISAWRHVVDLFKKENVTNVLWVWAPHLAYGQFKEYYPGDAYVDWVATGTLNYGTVAPWSQWWSFEEIFSRYYEELAEFNKPILIAEFGSLAVGGDRAKWYAEALKDFPRRFPTVRALIFFHNKSDGTTTYQSLNWYFVENRDITTAIKTQIKDWFTQ